MKRIMGRSWSIAVLAASAATAAAVAIASAAGPALADTTDTGGTATVRIATPFFSSMLKAGVMVVPGGTGTSTWVNGRDTATVPVTGGNGDITKLYGTIDLGGSLNFTDAVTGKTATFTNLQFSYDDGTLSGELNGDTSAQVPIADIGGNLSNDVTDTTQTFTASSLFADAAGAHALNSALGSTLFHGGARIGAFATTYTYTTS